MNVLKFQYIARSFNLDLCGIKKDTQEQIKQLLSPNHLAKQSPQDKTALINQLAAQTSFIDKNKAIEFSRFVAVCLIDVCQVDFRFEPLLNSSPSYAVIYDYLARHMAHDDEVQLLTFAHFAAATSRRLTPGKPRYEQIRVLFNELVADLPAAITKETVELLTYRLQILNRFLRNECFLAEFFCNNLDEEGIEQFYQTKLKLSGAGVEKLTNILQLSVQSFYPNVIYQCLIALWIASFEHQATDVMVDASLVPMLMRSVAQKNVQQNAKLVNTVCLLLSNLKKNERVVGYIVASNSQRLLQQLTTVAWPADSQIESNLNEILSMIQKQITETSTVQKYKIELDNKILEMSPLHSNPAFWKANSSQLTADQAVLMHKLIRIGETAIEKDDKQTLRVVLNDFGMFVTHAANGREWVERLPGMLKVAMDGLRVEDEDLQALAIQTVSKLLLNKVV